MKKILNIKKELSSNIIIERLYTFGLLILTFKTCCSNSALIKLNIVASYLYIIAMICILPKVILQDYKKNELIFLLLLLVQTIIAICYSDTKNLILIPISLIGIKNSDIKKIIKLIFYVTLFVIVAHTIVYLNKEIQLGVKFTDIFCFYKGIEKGKVLFNSNNNYGILTVCSIIQYIYITDRKNRKLLKIFSLLSYSLFVYLLGQSKTSLIISILAILYFIFEERTIFLKFNRIIKPLSFVSSILFSLSVFVIDLESRIGIFLNKLLTDRLLIEKRLINEIGISAFPQIYKYDQNVVFHIDNCYISLLLKWGVIFSLILLLIVIKLAFFQKNKIIDDYILSIIMIWGISENAPKLLTITIISLVLFNNYFEYNKNVENK